MTGSIDSSSSERTETCRSNPGNQSYDHNFKPKRFPDYILCGQLNLHRSAVNAAALSRYIAKQWDFLRINREGVISSHQLEINRDPESYGGLRNGKPLTVTEWTKLQKEKLIQKRKEQATLETTEAASGTTGAGAATATAATSSRGSSRGSRRGSRGRSRGRGENRGRGRTSSVENTSRGRGSSSSRGRSSGRGPSRGPSRGRTRRGSSAQRGRSRARGTTASDGTDTPGVKPDRIKLPRLARRNLRDKGGNLPRPRGPDRSPEPPQTNNCVPDALNTVESHVPDMPPSQPSEVQDELAPDALHPELAQSIQPNKFFIEQLDGNVSLSDSDTDPDTPENKMNLYEFDINGTASESSSHGDEVGFSLSTSGAEEESSLNIISQSSFDPPLTSTQDPDQITHPQSPQEPEDQIDQFLRQIRIQSAKGGQPQTDTSAELSDSNGNTSDGILTLGNYSQKSKRELSRYIQAGTQVIQENDTSGITLEPTIELAAHVSKINDESNDSVAEEMLQKYGVSPSAFLYAVQEPCVFLQRMINISGATVIMDPDAEEVRAAIVCSTHLNMWPDPEFCSGDMVTCLLKTEKHG